MKEPDPTHWTLNSRFGAFRTIWVHLGLFGCHTTLSAKWVKLVQKFVPRSLVGLLATNIPDPPHWTVNSCFGLFRIIWVHLGLFGCVTTLIVKWVKLVKTFVPWSPIGIFHNERTRSTPLDAKLMFWSFFYFLGAFWTVCVPYKTRCKTRQNWCKSLCHEVASDFFPTKAPDLPHWTLTHILVRSVLFGCIWDPLVALQHSVQSGSNWCKSSCHKVVLEFFAMNAPDPPHWTQKSWFRAFCSIWVHLGLFGCLPILSAKRVKLVEKFVPRSSIGIYHNEHTRSTALDPKLMLWCVSY